MNVQPHYRHELKYVIHTADYLALRQRLRAVMQPDEHARADGTYIIRSVYFDNVYDKALREKVNGVQQREKFRLRYYNDDMSFLVLEKKIKHNNLCMKLDAPLTYEQGKALLTGDTEWMLAYPSPLVQELYCKMTCQQLRPRVLVSYKREPYVYGPGNVRVTFDSDIRTSLYHRGFLQGPTPDISAGEHTDETVLEVKFDGFLPDAIGQLLQVGNLRQQAFSKYGVCRRFG